MISSNSLVTENYQKIRIDDYVRQVRSSLKKTIIEAQLVINRQSIKLCESKTLFGGLRLWFECPECHKRRGVLYNDLNDSRFKCRKCLCILEE